MCRLTRLKPILWLRNLILIKYGGDGLNFFMDNMLTLDEGMPDYQVILTYITEELGGTVDSTYAGPQGRIRIE